MRQQAVLKHVTFREFPVYPGPFAGRLGKLTETDVFSLLTGLRGTVTALQLTTVAKYDRARAQWRVEVTRQKVKTPICAAYGQRL